jgi:hypothetical protein
VVFKDYYKQRISDLKREETHIDEHIAKAGTQEEKLHLIREKQAIVRELEPYLIGLKKDPA